MAAIIMDVEGAGARQAQESIAGPSSVVNQAVAVADQPRVQWFRVRDINSTYGYPGVISTLIDRQRQGPDSGIRVFDMLATLSNAVMIESGFVPVVGQKPLRTAFEIQGMGEQERMIKLIGGDLLKILEEQETLRRVSYRYIVANEKHKAQDCRQAAARTDKSAKIARPVEPIFKYNDSDVVHIVMKEENAIRVCMTAPPGSTGLTLKFREIFPLAESANLDSMCLTPTDFLVKGEFNADNFSYFLKKSYIYPVLDECRAVSGEFRGMDRIPPEILIALAKRMDLRTFLSFSAANKRNQLTLRHSEEVWKSQLEKINKDLKEYGLPIPPDSSIRPGGHTTHELRCQSTYLDAVEMVRHQRNRLLLPPIIVPRYNRITISGSTPFTMF